MNYMIESRIQNLENFVQGFIGRKYTKKIKMQLDDLINMHKLTRDGSCIFISGLSGAGKTSLINDFLRDHPPIPLDEVTLLPVARVTLYKDIGRIDFYKKILRDLDHPYYSGTNDKVVLLEQVRRVVVEAKISLLIIDDAQHILSSRNGKIKFGVCDELVTLIKDLRIPVALFGAPFCQLAINVNSEMSTIFSRKCELPYYKLSTLEDFREFQSLIEFIMLQLELKYERDYDAKIIFRIYSLCGGSMKKIMDFFKVVAYEAIRLNVDTISVKLFSDCASILDSKMDVNNPFLLSIDKVKIYEPRASHSWSEFSNKLLGAIGLSSDTGVNFDLYSYKEILSILKSEEIAEK